MGEDEKKTNIGNHWEIGQKAHGRWRDVCYRKNKALYRTKRAEGWPPSFRLIHKFCVFLSFRLWKEI